MGTGPVLIFQSRSRAVNPPPGNWLIYRAPPAQAGDHSFPEKFQQGPPFKICKTCSPEGPLKICGPPHVKTIEGTALLSRSGCAEALGEIRRVHPLAPQGIGPMGRGPAGGTLNPPPLSGTQGFRSGARGVPPPVGTRGGGDRPL